MGTAAQYEALTWRVAQEEFPDNPELAQLFFNMMKQESGFSPDVVEGRRFSSAGARGIAQLMPSEIASAKAKNANFSEFNPEQALRHGADILRFNLNYFKGDTTKAAAAYNAGCGGVDRAVAKGGANWVSALPGETQSYVSIVAGGTTRQGGVTMAGTTTTLPTREDVIGWMAQFYTDDEYGTAQEKARDWFEEDPPKWIKSYQSFLGETATGTATTTLQTATPSPQETAINKWDMETWLYEAERDWKKEGIEVALTNFTNKITAAQEGRLQATAAQEYARNLAPAGMTELKLGPNIQGIPLSPAPAGSYAQAMQQGQQYVPQAPELQYQAPTLPQMPDLGALPATTTQQSYQTQVPYEAGGGLPNAGQPTGDTSFMQALRNYIARFQGGMTGAGGGFLPLGG
jgi:hypothetical protein